jgi:hypothetical protein
MLLTCLWHDSLIIPTTLTNGVMFGDTTFSINIVVAFAGPTQSVVTWLPFPLPFLPSLLTIFSCYSCEKKLLPFVVSIH